MVETSEVKNLPIEEPRFSRSFFRDALGYILRDKLTMLALSILLFFSLICFRLYMCFKELPARVEVKKVIRPVRVA
jgi:hypothetical protein